MGKFSFSDALAIVGVVLAIILVVLDKAGKLKGPMLFVLLGVAAAIMLPLALGNSWVVDATPGMLKFSRGMLMVSLVVLFYSLFAIWISSSRPSTKDISEDQPKKEQSSRASSDKETILPGTTQQSQTAPIDQEKLAEQIAEKIARLEKQPSPVLKAQLEQFTEIANFITRKDEIELRQTFDLQRILQFSILNAKSEFAPSLMTESQYQDLANFRLGGHTLLGKKYVNQTLSPNYVDTITPQPGKIGIIMLSKEYVDSRKKLTILILSSELPSDVVLALKFFDKAIDDNTNLMLDSLNESLAANPNNIIYNDVCPSDFCGSAANSFWMKSILLRPKADQIVEAIRHSLQIK